jgi:hypothetical protein
MPVGGQIFLPAIKSKTALGPIGLLFSENRSFSSRVKRPGRDADY